MDNCKNIRDLLEAYADGELPEKQKKRVERHVENCPHCAALLDEYLALNQAIADCAQRAPEGFTERVMQAVEQEKTADAKPQGRGVRLGKIAPFVGVGVAAVLCISVVSTSLVRYVFKNLSDGGLTVEQTTQATGGHTPNQPQEESPLPEAAPMPDTDEECGTYEDETIPEAPTYEETAAESIEPPTYEETAAESIEAPTYEPVETVPSMGESNGEQDNVPEQEISTGKPEVESNADPDAIESMQPETAQPAPETEAPEQQTQAPTQQEAETEAATEDALPSGFFARVWQAIEALFDKLWQAVSRLLGGDV